ncbi:MAG: hypothetical protein FWC50_04395 [Planctomycetaceae bacterium]|nr:hypothetical protein [Planctomycetaceae bacterium]
MSADYFIIAPENYSFETFLQRFPENIQVHDHVFEDKDEDYSFLEYCIVEKNGLWHGWLSMWDHKRNGFPTLEDAFTEEQMSTIKTIENARFFSVSAAYKEVLNIMVSLIANDPQVLINNDTDDPIIPGDQFVARLNLQPEDYEEKFLYNIGRDGKSHEDEKPLESDRRMESVADKRSMIAKCLRRLFGG